VCAIYTEKPNMSAAVKPVDRKSVNYNKQQKDDVVDSPVKSEYWYADVLNKKLSYCRETARQLHTSFSAHSMIVHFTEHRICLFYNYIID